VVAVAEAVTAEVTVAMEVTVVTAEAATNLSPR